MAYYGGSGSAPAGGGMAYAQPPRVRFDAIGEAWNLLRQQMGTWIVAILIMGVIVGIPATIMYIAVFAAAFAAAQQGGGNADPGGQLGLQLMANAFALALGVISAYFMGGLYKMAIKQVRGEAIAPGDVFSAGDVALPLIGAAFLVNLGTQLGGVFCVIPGLILGGLWMLTMPLIVDRKMGVIEAMGTSFNALKGDLLSATLFYIVLSIVAGIGVVLCGVGVLVTAPLWPLSIAIVYRDFFLGGQNNFGPSLDMPLPPQSAYGQQPPYGGTSSMPGSYPPPPPPAGGTPPPPAGGGMQSLGDLPPSPPPPPPSGGNNPPPPPSPPQL